MKALPSLRPLVRPLPWPMPALLVWLGAGGLWRVLDATAAGAALAAAAGIALALAWPGLAAWRRALVAGGFPLAALLHAVATGDWPAWGWLLPLALLLAAYPLRAWRDAPLYPTPREVLQGLQAVVGLPDGARVLDAGCGLGHGLDALQSALPGARLHGIEFSRPIAAAARRRCAFAHITRGDMWRADWSPYDLVYLFQRPESMARAWAKACAELREGAWLASLEFSIPGQAPDAVLHGASDKPVWLYRIPLFGGSVHSMAATSGR